MKLLRRFWPYARPHRGALAFTLAVAVAQALMDVPVPYILRHLVDGVLDTRGQPPAWLPADRAAAVRALCLALLGVALLKGLIALVRRASSERTAQNIIFDLRCDLFRHMTRLSLGFFRDTSTGRIILRFIGDINAILHLIKDGILRAATDVVTVAVVSALIVSLNLRLGLATLAVLPAYAFCFIRYSPRLREASHQVRNARSAFSGRLQEVISGMPVVKSFNREAAEEQRAREQTGLMRRHQLRRALFSGQLAGWANGLIGLAAAIVLGYGSTLVLSGAMTRGQLVAFYTLAAFLFPPMRRLAQVNDVYQESMVSLERIAGFLDKTKEATERPGALEFHPRGGSISLKGVTFGFGKHQPVLRGLDLEIAAGEMVAVVGPNGAGKSTLVSLLPRFIEPDAGTVMIDGQDVRDLTLESLRGALAIVPQDPFLFSGTIEDNIRYGKPGAGAAEIDRAVEAANLAKVLKRLPEGLATEVGERGLKISGGERQRIAIARALLMDPAILILDEATSGVDPESDIAIREALDRLMRGRTVIAIAHRLATTQRAGRIIVMNRGRVVEQGSHEQLLRRNGLYASLCESQLLDQDPGLAPIEEAGEK